MILGIETSGEIASLALVDEGRVVREDSFPSQMALCQRLMPRIQGLFETSDCHRFLPVGTPSSSAQPRRQKPVTVTSFAIAVSLGPGSFTSLRIGVATAKALAHAWEVPLVGIPTAHAIADGLTDVPERALVCALAVARKGHLYAALLQRSPEGIWQDAAPCEVLTPEQLAEELAQRPEPIVLCGEAALAYRDCLAKRLGGRFRVAPEDQLRPTARHVAFVGARELQRRGPDDLFSLTPIYAQPSQAEAARGIDLGL